MYRVTTTRAGRTETIAEHADDDAEGAIEAWDSACKSVSADTAVTLTALPESADD